MVKNIWSDNSSSVHSSVSVYYMETTLTKTNTREVRCNQAGDWWNKDDETTMANSVPMSDERSEFAVLIHELVEAFLCRYAGVTEQSVLNHDVMFEKERADGLHDEWVEAGDDPRAPYKDQHFVATTIERILCVAMKLPWEYHEAIVVEALK